MSAGKALSNLKLEKLKPDHQVEEFACGHEALDRYLRRFAWANQKAEAAQTYVAVHESRTVIGYYSLAVGQVTFDDAPERLAKGLARHPVPVMLLARLAVDQGWHGHRLGSALLRDAVLRTLQAADIAGIRAMVVHAKDDAARRFYERFDFLPFTNEPLTLYRLIKDLRRAAQPEADAS